MPWSCPRPPPIGLLPLDKLKLTGFQLSAFVFACCTPWGMAGRWPSPALGAGRYNSPAKLLETRRG